MNLNSGVACSHTYYVSAKPISKKIKNTLDLFNFFCLYHTLPFHFFHIIRCEREESLNKREANLIKQEIEEEKNKKAYYLSV